MGQEVSGSGRVESPVGILEVAWEGDCLLRLDLLYALDTPDADGAAAPEWAPTLDQATAPDWGPTLDQAAAPNRGIASGRVPTTDRALTSDRVSASDRASPADWAASASAWALPDLAWDEERLNASPLPAAIRAALDRYFRDGRAGLDLPLAPAGTPFQHRVWQALRAIPPGSTRTYGELARELGTSARAIGGACRANPCLIAVPCHRVVARDSLGGFAGERGGKRLAVKRWLLRHEGAAAGRLP